MKLKYAVIAVATIALMAAGCSKQQTNNQPISSPETNNNTTNNTPPGNGLMGKYLIQSTGTDGSMMDSQNASGTILNK